MRFLVKILVAATVLCGTQARAQASLDVAGTWLTEDGRAKIRTEHCGDKLCGYVVWMKQPLTDKGEPKTDIKNPDPAKRNRPSIGLELMAGLKAEDETHYSGQIYNAEDGKMYDVTVSIEKAEELNVHGCLLRFLCGSQSWERVADIALPATATKVVATVPPAGKPAKPGATGGKHDTAPSK